MTGTLQARLIGVLLAMTSPTVHAQENVVLRARDAFGERIGEESAGLYNENQVRGFDMANTGAYRINGAYYFREFPLPDVVLSGVSINVGINAARLPYPSPSGVVNYRLREPKAGDPRLTFTAGMRDFGQPFVELWSSYTRADGRFALGAGIDLLPWTENGYGRAGYTYSFGAVPVWTPSDRVRIKGLLTSDWSYYNGNVNFATVDRVLPPKVPPKALGAPWGKNDRLTVNGGVMAEVDFSADWRASASAFYASTERSPQDFTLHTFLPGAQVRTTFLRNTLQQGRSFTGEATVVRGFDTGATRHEIALALRTRHSQVVTKSITPQTFPLDLARLNYPPTPDLETVTNGRNSTVDQHTGSVSYSADIGQRIEIRAAGHSVRYTKTSRAIPDPAISRRQENTLTYNASVVGILSPRTRLFASIASGLEESGVAPQNAVNRNEVLAPVTARQIEVGGLTGLGAGLNLGGAVFQVTKPVAGLAPDGVFKFIGEARHRGAELSITGRVTPQTAVVAGAVFVDPRISGALTRAGLLGERVVGASRTAAIVSVDHQILRWPGLSVDARVAWQGPRAVDSANRLFDTGTLSASLGARYAFRWKDYDVTARVVASNIATQRPWSVGTSGLLMPGSPFTVRANVRLSRARTD